MIRVRRLDQSEVDVVGGFLQLPLFELRLGVQTLGPGVIVFPRRSFEFDQCVR